MARLRKLLADISGHQIEDDDYVSYFVNEHGEQMLFVRQAASPQAVLLHSDLDWEPKLVAGTPMTGANYPGLSPAARRFMGDTPVIGDTILNHAEAQWLKACFAASERW